MATDTKVDLRVEAERLASKLHHAAMAFRAIAEGDKSYDPLLWEGICRNAYRDFDIAMGRKEGR